MSKVAIKPLKGVQELLGNMEQEGNRRKYQGLDWLCANKGRINLGDYDINKDDQNGILTVSHKGKTVASFTPDGEYRETQHTTPADRNNITGMSQLGNQASLGQNTGESSLSPGVFLSETIQLIIESLKRFLEFARNQNDAERQSVEQQREIEHG